MLSCYGYLLLCREQASNRRQVREAMQLENPTQHEGLQVAGTRLGALSLCNHVSMHADVEWM